MAEDKIKEELIQAKTDIAVLMAIVRKIWALVIIILVSSLGQNAIGVANFTKLQEVPLANYVNLFKEE